jgi:hypothetical protein
LEIHADCSLRQKFEFIRPVRFRCVLEKRDPDFTTLACRSVQAEHLCRFLKHKQDVPGGVFEPRDQRPAAAKDSLVVRFEITVVALERTPFLDSWSTMSATGMP